MSDTDLVLPWGAASGGVRSGGADAFEQDGCGLVVGVLGEEFAFEGFLEDGLERAGGTMSVRVNRGIEIIDQRQMILQVGDESLLLFDPRWELEAREFWSY